MYVLFLVPGDKIWLVELFQANMNPFKTFFCLTVRFLCQIASFTSLFKMDVTLPAVRRPQSPRCPQTSVTQDVTRSAPRMRHKTLWTARLTRTMRFTTRPGDGGGCGDWFREDSLQVPRKPLWMGFCKRYATRILNNGPLVAFLPCKIIYLRWNLALWPLSFVPNYSSVSHFLI